MPNFTPGQPQNEAAPVTTWTITYRLPGTSWDQTHEVSAPNEDDAKAILLDKFPKASGIRVQRKPDPAEADAQQARAREQAETHALTPEELRLRRVIAGGAFRGVMQAWLLVFLFVLALFGVNACMEHQAREEQARRDSLPSWRR